MKKWNVKNNAVLRTALFFEITGLNINSIEKIIFQCSSLLKKTEKICQTCSDYICSLIDEFFTPYIIKELNINSHLLSGDDNYQKYASFFLTDELCWTKQALQIENKYETQIKNISKLVEFEIKSIQVFFKRLNLDIIEIRKKFNIKNSYVQNIIIQPSDRHNFNGPIVFVVFSNGVKVVYKPKSAESDIFEKFIYSTLTSEKILNFPKFLNKRNYCWSEYIKYKACKNEFDFKKIYYGLGILLAVHDVFNFTDGHAENFVVNKNQFIPVDTETILTNLSDFKEKTNHYYDLSFTGMIQPSNKKMPYQSLLRDRRKVSFFPYCPHIIHDNTDSITFKYRRFKVNTADNSFPAKEKICLKQYVEYIIEGLGVGYDLLKSRKEELLRFLRKTNIRTRHIIRPTLYYTWVIYRYLHPENKKFKSFLEKKLRNLSEDIFDYEKKYVKYGNIPVFYQKLHSRHLYGYDEIVEKNYFEHTGYFWVKKKLRDLNDESFIKKRKWEIINSIKD